ncbi:MAG: DoxX family protein [Gemmatimonadaceae bacterium]
MQAAALTSRPVASVSWTGRILTGVVIAFMVFDAILHILKPAPVVDAFTQLGYPLRLAVGLGVIELICTLLYAIPRTSFAGALLLTGYLGGAIATQLRIDAGWFPTLFPIIIGALLWGGLALRDSRVRGLLG